MEYEKHSKGPEPVAAKVEVSLRVGVFFDGTGNNANNAALGERCGAHHPVRPEDLDPSCKPYMADPDSSYGNDVTNIRKLYDLYSEDIGPYGQGDQKRISRKLYVEGIGTTASGKDSVLGAGAGRGQTGVGARVQQAFVDINGLITRVHNDNPDCTITSLVFDVFGFSRGAAAARHFANEVVCGKRGPLGQALRANAKAFGVTFIDEYQRGLQIGFIGLFDTVASVGGFSNLGNVRSPVAPGVKLHLSPRYFSNVVHLVARDEWRSNFALNSVAPDHLEVVLPGAHSDIGGGYLVDAEESVLVSPMQALTVRQGTDVRTTSIYRDAAQAKDRMVAAGWPESVLKIVTPDPVLLPIDPQDRLAPRQQRLFAGLRIKRRVRGELSRVYMRVMYERAKERGALFDAIDDNDPHHSIPTELRSLCARFVTGDYSTTEMDDALLRERYIHASGHWNHPLGKTSPGGLKIVYINAPNASGVRMQHPHVPDWSLL
jgi:hypothetical protein